MLGRLVPSALAPSSVKGEGTKDCRHEMCSVPPRPLPFQVYINEEQLANCTAGATMHVTCWVPYRELMREFVGRS